VFSCSPGRARLPKGGSLQRLFSTFANGWPGLGLLLQRLILGTALIGHGAIAYRDAVAIEQILPELIASGLALFILAGLWTPATGSLVAALELWIALIRTGNEAAVVILATLAGTLAMIGPGAWSIDARIFGRKHIAG
jgi:putative oxidoreductase